MTQVNETSNWVLNTDSQEVYFLPINAKQVADLNVVSMNDELEIFVVNEDGFESVVDVLRDKLNYPETPDELTESYFVMRCNQASGYGTPILSDKAYRIIYGYLVDSGFTITDMIKQMHRVVMTWHEDTPIDILFDADKYSYDNPEESRTDDELLNQAIDVICEDDFKTFYDSYDNDGQDVILYSAS